MKFKSWKQRAEDRSTSVSTEKRRYKADPRYPRLMQISPGRVGFVDDELDAYDRSLITERDNALAKHGESKPAEGAEASAA